MSGTYLQYVPTNFGNAALETIRQVNIIVNEYQEQGITLTLRSLHYQLVSRDITPNTPADYQKLSRIVSDGRLAGLISWTAIEDHGRNVYDSATWRTAKDAFISARQRFKMDLWANQPCRLYVGVEKDGMLGIIETICSKLRVPFTSFHGYNSQSAAWRLGRTFADHYMKGQRPILLHLGDHDPSGLDMTRDNRERLSMFAGVEVPIIRLALNREQIDEVNPPPNPAKLNDPRAEAYIAEFGHTSWELDALSPTYISKLIEREVYKFRDPAKWDEALAMEAEELNTMDILLESLT